MPFQIAKSLGAEVTAVDRVEKLDMMRAIGADHIIDFASEDFTVTGKQYDLIFDVKTTRSIFDFDRALTPNGRYVTIGGKTSRILQLLFLGKLVSKHRMSMVMYQPNKDLDYLMELFETGKLTPVLDKQ